VVVNGGGDALGPTEQHQVEPSIAGVHQITRVLELVELGVLSPVVGARDVAGQEALHVVHVDPLVREHAVELGDQLL